MEHGRVMVAITLVEDLAVVILIVLLPNFGSLDSARLLILGKSLGKAALILVPALLLAAKILPPVLRTVARTRSPELFFGVVLAIGLGTAALYASRWTFACARCICRWPHDFRVAICPGGSGTTLSSPRFVRGALLRDAGTPGGSKIIVCRSALAGRHGWTHPGGQIRYLDLGGPDFGYSIWTAVLVGVGLTQIGEFSFILVQVARNSGLVDQNVYNATLAASLISILVNAALIRYVPNWIGQVRLARQAVPAALAPQALTNHVVLSGYGRVGGEIGTALDTFHIPYVVH